MSTMFVIALLPKNNPRGSSHGKGGEVWRVFPRCRRREDRFGRVETQQNKGEGERNPLTTTGRSKHTYTSCSPTGINLCPGYNVCDVTLMYVETCQFSSVLFEITRVKSIIRVAVSQICHQQWWYSLSQEKSLRLL